jgi:uncharacterized protein
MDSQITRLIDLPEDQSFFLFGARQTGKTTLIKKLFSGKALFFNLLDQELITNLKRNTRNFREAILARDCKQITHIVVDEIQKFPDLLDEVQFIMTSIDRPPHFILTGSSARKLKRSGVNMLGGRAWSYYLSPLCYKELEKKYPATNFPLTKVLQYGSLPAVFLEFNPHKAQMMLKAYYDTYIKEEIRLEALVKNLDAFSVFLEIAASQNGELLNYSNIASDLGINHNTVKEYYQILEDTLMGFFLRPFSKQAKKRLVRSPKFYFFDTGVARVIQGNISRNLDYGEKEFGKSFEHYIIKEIIDSTRYLNKDYKFYFYRTEAGAEVDLIIERPGSSTVAIEIKSNNNPQPKNLRGLISFKKTITDSELYCVCLAEHKRKEGEIIILPWQEIFDII